MFYWSQNIEAKFILCILQNSLELRETRIRLSFMSTSTVYQLLAVRHLFSALFSRLMSLAALFINSSEGEQRTYVPGPDFHFQAKLQHINKIRI